MAKKLSNREVSPRRLEFLKLKQFVTKRFPGAHTIAKVAEGKTHYAVIDGSGHSIVSPDLLMPQASSVREAWEQAKYGAWFSNMIRKSNAAFNEEKILRQIAKDSGE